MMFKSRASEFDPHVSAILDHLYAIQNELRQIGSAAGRAGAESVSAGTSQIADAAVPILNDILERFRRGQRAAVGRAADLGDQALKVTGKAGNQAVASLAGQVQQRPL